MLLDDAFRVRVGRGIDDHFSKSYTSYVRVGGSSYEFHLVAWNFDFRDRGSGLEMRMGLSGGFDFFEATVTMGSLVRRRSPAGVEM